MPDWSLIDGDPAPGRPDVVEGIGRAWGRVARNAGSARTSLQLAGNGVPAAGWVGAAADETASRILLVVPHIDKFAGSYQDAADALVRFADTLRGLQTWARRVCAEAEHAAARLHAAQAAQRQAQEHENVARQRRDEAGRSVDRLNRQARSAATPDDLAVIQQQLVDAKWRLRSAQRRLGDAQRARLDAEARCRVQENQLSQLRSQAQIIRGNWQGDVRDVVAALNRAAEHRLQGPNAVGRAWQATWAVADRTWDDLWELGSAVVSSQVFDDVLGWLDIASTACTILAFLPIPGVSQVLLGVGVGLGALVLVGRVAQMANGTREWTLGNFVELGFDAAGVVAGSASLRNMHKLAKAGTGGSSFAAETKRLIKFGDAGNKTEWLRRRELGKALDKHLITKTAAHRWSLAFPGCSREATYRGYYLLHWGSAGYDGITGSQEIIKSVRKREWSIDSVQGGLDVVETVVDVVH